MTIKRLALMIIMLLGLIFFPVYTIADSVERLLDLLKAKGVITEEEAAALRKEVQEEKEQKAKIPTQPQVEAKAELKAKTWTDDIDLGYKDGFFIKTTDDRFSLKLNGGFEPLFQYANEESGSDVRTFQIRRARLYLSGNAFYPWLQFYTQLTLEGGNSALRDYTLSATYFKELQPTIGQFKVPFDREFLTSGFNLQLIERSIASTEFSLQRDIGFQLSGKLFRDMLEYRAGVFNGSGVNQLNVDQDLMYVGRLVFTPFGPVPYSQGALERPSTPRLAIGGGVAYLPGLEPGERKSLAGVLGNAKILPVESDVTELTADLAFQYQDFSFEGAYYFRRIDPRVKTKYQSADAKGFFVQGGYFIIPKHLELAARYSLLDPDNPVTRENNRQQEFTLGPSYYLWGHKLKVQGNYTFQTTESPTGKLKDNIGRLGMVLMF